MPEATVTTPQETQTALAVPAPQGELAERRELLDTGGIAIWEGRRAMLDNFDGDERAKFELRLLAMNDAKKGSEHLKERIMLKYWMVHEIEILKEDGELVPCYRVVLITPDLRAYGFVSDVLARAIREIYREYGRAPIDPPIPVQIKQKDTQGGKRCFIIAPAPDTLVEAT